MERKICKECNLEKPSSEFTKTKQTCKKCIAKKTRILRDNKPKYIKDSNGDIKYINYGDYIKDKSISFEEYSELLKQNEELMDKLIELNKEYKESLQQNIKRQEIINRQKESISSLYCDKNLLQIESQISNQLLDKIIQDNGLQDKKWTLEK